LLAAAEAVGAAVAPVLGGGAVAVVAVALSSGAVLAEGAALGSALALGTALALGAALAVVVVSALTLALVLVAAPSVWSPLHAASVANATPATRIQLARFICARLCMNPGLRATAAPS
jgi:hypothetical protein